MLVFGAVIGLAAVEHQIRNEEFARVQRETSRTNDAFVQHTLSVVSQGDSLLRSVRGYFLRTLSIDQTETFIASLGWICRPIGPGAANFALV